MTLFTNLFHKKEHIFNNITINKIIFYFSWFLCFSIALPHHILPGKAGFISLLLFTLWIIEGNLKVKIRILYENKLFLSIFSLIFMFSISLLWSEHSNIGIQRLTAFKYYIFIIPVLITSLSKNDALELIRAFVIGTILHALLMVLLTYNIINLPTKITLYSPYSVYSPFFVFSSFYCFYFFHRNLNNKNIMRSFIYLFVFIALAYIIFTNKGRSGQIAFLCSALLTLFLLHQSWKKTIVFFLITSALLVTIILSSQTVKSTYIAAINDIKNIEKGNYIGSWGERWGMLTISYEVIKTHPISGVGLGDIKSEMKKIIIRKENKNLQRLSRYDGSHNFYITVITSTGIIGLILYFIVHIFIFKLPIAKKEIKHLSLIFLTILIVNGIADDILSYKPYNVYFAIMIALFINLSLDEKDKSILFVKKT